MIDNISSVKSSISSMEYAESGFQTIETDMNIGVLAHKDLFQVLVTAFLNVAFAACMNTGLNSEEAWVPLQECPMPLLNSSLCSCKRQMQSSRWRSQALETNLYGQEHQCSCQFQQFESHSLHISLRIYCRSSTGGHLERCLRRVHEHWLGHIAGVSECQELVRKHFGNCCT